MTCEEVIRDSHDHSWSEHILIKKKIKQLSVHPRIMGQAETDIGKGGFFLKKKVAHTDIHIYFYNNKVKWNHETNNNPKGFICQIAFSFF
jgi:hypothetical protein